MDWFPLHITMLDSPEFLRATAAEQATWIFLLRYCCGQENGGVIAGARQWSKADWRLMTRANSAVIEKGSPLWQWKGNDLIVWNYPTDNEQSVQRHRKASKDWYDRKAGNKKTSVRPQSDGSLTSRAEEGENSEEKEDQGEPSSDPHFVLPSDEEMKTAAAAYPGNAAIGAPAKIPAWWALDLLAWGKEHPDRWPGDRWQTWLVKRFEQDWQDKSSRLHRKNAAAAEQHRLPDDEPDWWELPLDQLNARLTGIALRGDTKARDRVKEILKLRGWNS